MTSINEKMGMKRAGKRAMMKLPTDLALRARVTSAICPLCGRTGARLSKTQPGSLYSSWCNHRWSLPALTAKGTAAMSTDPREPPPPVETPQAPTSVPDEDDRESDRDDDDTSDSDEAERQYDLPGTEKPER